MKFTKTNGDTKQDFFSVIFKKFPTISFTMADVVKVVFYCVYTISLLIGIFVALIAGGKYIWNIQAEDLKDEIRYMHDDIQRIDSVQRDTSNDIKIIKEYISKQKTIDSLKLKLELEKKK